MRGTYRHGLDGHYSREINRGGGFTPATVSRNREREGEDCREKEDDRRDPLSVKEGQEEGTGSGRGVAGPWAGKVPGVHFYFYFFFSLLPFSSF
jgi:hypothetical protein